MTTAKVTKTDVPLSAFLRSEEDVDELTINVDGVDTKWEYRSLSWYEKNKCIAKATTFSAGEDGQTNFSFDLATYYAEALTMMITSAPLPISSVSIRNMKAEIGDKLSAIVPAPMAGDSADTTKKD